jgi:predicted DNA-binding transcriptional regulator YafY
MNRQFEMVYLLLEKKCITANELSEHLGVSVRTVYRDVETLGMAGIPIYTKQGKNGGIAILNNFVLDKGIVSKEEQQQIVSALQSMQEVEQDSGSSVLSKLCGIFQIENPNWVSIDFSDWSNQRQELFATVKNAILKRRVVSFEYYSRDNKLTTRIVEPIQLWFKGYTWFLRAYCRERQAMRIFKLKRMHRGECLDEIFELKNIDLKEEKKFINNELTSKKVLSFSMRIDKFMGYQVYDSFEEHEITRNEDGSFTVSLCYPEDEWVYGMILSYGSHAKIISPESMKVEVVNRLKRNLKNYC